MAQQQPAPEGRRPIRRLLVANRGELVPRIARTCRALGVRCLALVAPDQQDAWWVRGADEALALEGSYLDSAAVLDAARRAGADALHPGYGFLAESAEFADAVASAGLTWVGPPGRAMRELGDKAAARRLAARAGVPVLPGYDGDDQSDDALAREAARLGFPLLVKPSAGGGGKGMHVLTGPESLEDVLGRARREARTAFGDDRLVLERYVPSPRHVEIQLLFDEHGSGVHLGERDCSLQRRHQKVVEESPSPAVDGDLREQLGRAALELASAAGYVGAGTAEFLLDEQRRFYFLELNARLQVEHPVTELVTGRDLVADQLRVAAGEPLGFGQEDVGVRGHAVEVRLYAEDPWAAFLPATGTVRAVSWPVGDGIRIDAGIGQGDVVGTRYDPLLAKLLAVGADRGEAIRRLDDALARTAVLGVTTNRGFLRWLLAVPEVRSGDPRTDTIERHWRGDEELPDQAWREAGAALAKHLRPGTWNSLGFRLNARPSFRVTIGREERLVELDRATPTIAWTASGPDAVVMDLDGRSLEAALAPAPTVESAVRHAQHGASAGPAVTAPMPGSVLAVRVTEGQAVEAGQTLLVLEAMKMENAVTAPAAGRVTRIHVAAGQQVQRLDPLVEMG